MSAPARTRALLEDRDGARVVDVLDTGRRRRLVIDGVIAKGERIWTLAHDRERRRRQRAEARATRAGGEA